MNDYQRGIKDLQDLLRKHGVVMVGCKGLGKSYCKFLKDNGLSRRKATKAQRETIDYLDTYGIDPKYRIIITTGSSNITYENPTKSFKEGQV